MHSFSERMWIVLRIPIAVFLSVLAVALFSYGTDATPMPSEVTRFVFPGLTGPSAASVLPPDVPTPWQRHHGGTVSRLALYVADAGSSWLGLAHGLRTIGIPFSVITDFDDALRHTVVLLYLSTGDLSRTQWEAIVARAETGATVIAWANQHPATKC